VFAGIVQFIASQIFGNAAIMLGLIALIGLLLLRRPFGDVLKGTVRTIIGYYILLAGAMALTDLVTPLSAWVGQLLGVKGVQPGVWIVFGIGMSDYGSETAIAMLIGFILNLLLARFTRAKTIHITGHIMLIVTAFFVTVAAGYGFNSGQIIVIAAIFSGLYYWLEPWLSHKFMKGNDRLTDEWSLGTGDAVGIAATSWLSKLVGKREESTEDMEFPAGLEWLRDSQIAIAVFSSIVYVVLGLAAGQAAVLKFSGSTNWVMYLLLNGVYFSAALAMLLYGVRILIAEIVPAFAGFSERLIPGAIPGLDYPTTFQFAPTGMFIGYVMNLIGGVLATLVMAALGMPVVILPSIFMNFWSGALFGVFANAWGGRRAAFIAPLILGFVAPFGWALTYQLSGSVLVNAATVTDYTDVTLFGPLYCLFIRLLAGVLGVS